MTTRSILRGGLQRSALVVFGLVLAFALAEGGLRFAGWLQGLDYRLYLRELKNSRVVPFEIWQDPEGGDFEGIVMRARRRYPPFRPGALEVATTSDFSVLYRVNSLGLRDAEHSFERVPGRARYLAIGDSFTFGSGLDYGERFSEVAERSFDDLEIVNMGVPGYGLDDVLLSYIEAGARYRPDAVVVILNRQVVRRHFTGIYDRGEVRIGDADRAAPVVDAGDAETVFLARNDPLFQQSPCWVRASYLLSYASYRVQIFRLQQRLRDQDAKFWAHALRAREPEEIVSVAHPARRERAIALLGALRDRANADGVRVIVVNIDDGQRWEFLADIPGIVYHDLSEPLHRRGREQPLRFRFDRHYNAATNAFIGRALAEILHADRAAADEAGNPPEAPHPQ
ncbi:MAG: SGNH/GDSL hydrolase family protein [Deltaproteobacteria bacterium]|nr:SGNH/GDSL hydrolase family protein [Deltaproteobacteria bacterium]MBW2402080.1 SGNH/GDSL hydrolase family protein [Deltaproteobacteria bacterium]